MRDTRKILQIIPAGDWCAVYLNDKEPWFTIFALACWALTKDEDGESEVIGMDATDYVDFAPNMQSFYAYISRSEITNEMKDHWILEGQKGTARKKK